MKALAAFLFKYRDDPSSSPAELRLIYKDGFFDIDDEMTWFRLIDQHAAPRDAAAEMIDYHRRACNWIEIEL